MKTDNDGFPIFEFKDFYVEDNNPIANLKPGLIVHQYANQLLYEWIERNLSKPCVHEGVDKRGWATGSPYWKCKHCDIPLKPVTEIVRWEPRELGEGEPQLY